MNYKRLSLLKLCIRFFMQFICISIILTICYIVAYIQLRSFGLTIMILASLVILFFYAKNLYYVFHDIYSMNIEEFEGKITHTEYYLYRNILPCGIVVARTDKKANKYHDFHSNKKINANIGDIVRLSYLKKSKIIVTIDIIKKNRKNSKK